MPSSAYETWTAVRVARLNEIEAAHRSLGGPGPGRRYATQQINQAYVVMLAAQFQGFCRDLHTECANTLVATLSPAPLRSVWARDLLEGRKLNRGNANAGNIGADFNRFGIAFWPSVQAIDPRNRIRQRLLDELQTWRNGIVHQDFAFLGQGVATSIQLRIVRNWRSACDGLGRTFDMVMQAHLTTMTGQRPW